MKEFQRYWYIACCAVFCIFNSAMAQNECQNWQANHSDWIFCDDFEDTGSLVKPGRYFEYDSNAGDFVPKPGLGVNGSRGMQVRWQAGEVGAGSIKLSFGRNPNAYMNKQNIRPTQDFREIYYRMYLKMQTGWQGSPAKLSRATCFTSANDWRQAMIAHLWSDDSAHLLIDPASCVNAAGVVQCTTYNDFNHLTWLGNKSGITPLFATSNSGKWFCIEAHVKLNDPGVANGVQEFWIDGNLEARREGLNFVGTYSDYAINAVFFENYWNAGSPVQQERYFDNIVVSTKPIGCLQAGVMVPEGKYGTANDRKITITVFRRNGKDILEIRNAIAGRYHIVTLTGRRIAEGEVARNGRTTVDLSEIPFGIYFAGINAVDGGLVEKRLVGGK
ncbi:MAG TPA: hypothetical protein VLX68_12640 [Chitinivibrionales bacterium]|nr:hypothetical protein [Chitinivibrionales bacterium]